MSLNDLFEHVDRNRDAYLASLFKLLRQPSISAQKIGVRDCAKLLAGIVKEAGLEPEIVETAGEPVVFGRRMVSPERFTILFYGHYDVQPPEPLADWVSPPFSPTLRNGKIFARGAADNKGQLIAHLLALKTWQEIRGELPINVKVVFEGEEESSSPHLNQFVLENREKLRADLVYTSDGPLHETGSPMVLLGVRGILYVEMIARGAKWDNHSGNKGGVVPNPAWKLIDLLRTMRSPDGRVTIEGFYDGIEMPAPVILDLIRKLPFDRDKTREAIGWDEFDLDAETYYRRLTLEPTFNIAGFTSGYGGEGSKTIIPAKALLKIDFRLVVDQDPEDVFRKISDHVKRHAPDVELRFLGAMKPSRTAPDLKPVQAVIGAVRAAYGVDPLVQPSLGGSLPDYVWTKTLGIPSVVVPYANADESNHAPNENLDLEKFYQGIKCTLSVLSGLGNGG
jgi:acetylornithine deacetylase/succinyl-diaminopimelate desuccinylase-like protein